MLSVPLSKTSHLEAVQEEHHWPGRLSSWLMVQLWQREGEGQPAQACLLAISLWELICVSVPPDAACVLHSASRQGQGGHQERERESRASVMHHAA